MFHFFNVYFKSEKNNSWAIVLYNVSQIKKPHKIIVK